MSPKISVIIPCYNVELLIDRCLQSIVLQSYGLQNIEVICVDDCSTDNTYQMLLAWENRYPANFIIIESPQNGRQGQARNIGLQYATGEWIAYIDSDDWIDPTYLEDMFSMTIGHDYDIVCCGYARDGSSELTYFEDNDETYTEIVINTDEERKRIIMNPPLAYNAWAKIIKKQFLINNELYFPQNITYEDSAWGSLVHLYVKSACVLKRKLYHYYVNQESTVLTKNSNHHLDCMTSQVIVWNEYIRRGFLERYKEELEIEHIYSAFLPGIKMAILRYEKPDYNVYLLLRTIILSQIPYYENNKYIREGMLGEYYMLILEALKNQLSRNEFLEFADNIKTIGI